ncbi:hypothetical protein BCON_0017g00660 [Botryotinia convoluta]|uniref:Thioester reductase (TE) domain-containing protein n=1 Tax=Botryotinia convoluta TaxID=54673 RepID=A0A4Z1J0Y6_9HELO|nr:hypothetical protein BCON_0017g00660 [Botryotinia convoluta]
MGPLTEPAYGERLLHQTLDYLSRVSPHRLNPPATNASLLEQTQCSIILHAEEVAPIVQQLYSVRSEVRSFVIPSFQTILAGDGRAFMYEEQTYQAAKNNPIVVLHSSGSTGIPKPIMMTHGTIAVLDNERNLPGVPGRKNRDFSIWDFQGGGKFYHVFPYFRLAGFLSNIVNPTFTEASSPVLGPPLEPPSATLLKEIMKHQKLRALYIPPAIAEQLLQEPEGIDFFRDLDFLCYTGAPFSPNAGKQLVEVTELCSLYGSTEAFQVPQLAPSKEDWAYMECNPNFKLEMQPSEDEDRAYELVLFTDESTERMSALNHNLPGTKEWRTKDLFMPHPKKQNLWRYYGRRDDIIVLSNSEKFNPVPMELMIQGHPLLAGALVIGNGRVRATLLLEPKPQVQGRERKSLIETLWPCVEEANALAPGHGRILISNIIIADKSFSRAGKGTIVCKLTEKAFEEEIEALYKQTKLSTSNKIPSLKAIFERERRRSLFTWFRLALDYRAGGYSEIRNFTICYDFLNSRHTPQGSNAQARISTMENLVRKYTHNLPVRSPYSPGDAPQTSPKMCIAITGSTGALGTVLLSTLLPNLRISRIYCLNRNVSARVTQESILANRGIEYSLFSKLHFMTVKIDSPNLGLPFSDYSMLVDDIDIIIHNAWKVDFNFSLQSFEIPYLRSFRVGGYGCDSGDLIQEEPARDSETAFKLGYGESKAVAEGILNIANRISMVPTIILRIGQISGPTSPTDPPWPKQECLYPILLASKTLCLLPQQLTPIDWIPIDLVAAVISEILASYGDVSSISEAKYSSESEDEKNIQVYNVVNPAPISWDLLVEILQERFGKDYGRQIKILPLREWVEEIEKYSANLDVKTMGIGATLKPALNMIKDWGIGRQ